ncbi:MAG: radical SAM protein [Bacteroidaceae bacterium]|nr:radical SAM protein [Bacteroidaceae bacterium]
MSTVIYPSPIFGPIKSRRLGISLGINLLPGDGKVCTFDCLYCECGFNAERRPKQKLPTRCEVAHALEQKLQQMQDEGVAPDVLTFAGNGEPTAHPDFAGVINDTLALRDRYFPQAKVSVLTNGTRINRAEVFEALKRVDNNIVKLDTVDMDYISRIDRPVGQYDLPALLECMRAFEGRCVIQTMFMKGVDAEGVSVDNTTSEYVYPWLDAVGRIAPREVMIYTIDRETPAHGLLKATHEELDHIVALLQARGIKASASY